MTGAQVYLVVIGDQVVNRVIGEPPADLYPTGAEITPCSDETAHVGIGWCRIDGVWMDPAPAPQAGE